MIRKGEELLAMIKGVIGEDTSDESLQLIEDVSDTINDYEDRAKEDWKAKYEANDKTWREKYRDRFFNGKPESEPDDEPDDERPKRLTYENLFKEG